MTTSCLNWCDYSNVEAIYHWKLGNKSKTLRDFQKFRSQYIFFCDFFKSIYYTSIAQNCQIYKALKIQSHLK